MNLEIFGWTPTIGDPTIYGWLTVAAYALGAFVCWRAAASAPTKERRFWIVLAAIMAFLCINKQLDLQTLMTDFGRFQAKKHGWYDERRIYQLAFIFALGAVSALATSALLVRMRRARPPVWGGIAGLALLLFFIFVRAISFDKMDWLISQHLGTVRVNHLMELGGIAMVAISALAAARRR
ncbi:hypothetical protein [Sphingomonas sp.]|uniref:hypothetical protein n=1 Tax=Sphingomonas sp. TaxID=28214 RepID=UPI00389FBA02